jgi:hypothetical protein
VNPVPLDDRVAEIRADFPAAFRMESSQARSEGVGAPQDAVAVLVA